MVDVGWYPDPERVDTIRYWNGATWTERSATREALPVAAAKPSGVVSRPQPRLIRSASEAEEVAAEWLRWFGFEGAQTTGTRVDGGVDVRGRALVAQVKMHLAPVSRADLQRIHAVAVSERAVAVVFSLSDYLREAQEWAEAVRMALFRFSYAGEAEPVNSYAVALFEQARQHSRLPPEAESPWWAIPLGCDDATAYWTLMPRQGFFQRQQDQIMWVRQGWLPVATFRYEFTYVAVQGGWGHQFRFGEAAAAIEMTEGYAVGVPPSFANMIQVPAEWMNLRPRFGIDELGEMILGARHRHNPWFPANRAHDVALHRFNVPPNVANLQISSTGTFLMPIFTALIAGPDGYRIAVVEGITGELDRHLSAHFTWHAPRLLDELYDGRPLGL